MEIEVEICDRCGECFSWHDEVNGIRKVDFYKNWAEVGSEIPYAVTHWMPLPEPPKEV